MVSNGVKDLTLNEREQIRYNRQIIYGDFGEEGQLKLKGAHVLVAGTGGLGSPNAINLTYAGVGKITIVDCDVVELSNLNRQSLHWEENIDQKKVYSGAEKLRRMNPDIEVIPLHIKITRENVDGLIADCDLVIDCMDNMETRFIINAACVKKGIPFIFGGIRGLEGQITTIIPGKTPCLECIFPRGIEGKKPFPVFGVTPAFIASLQSMEAIKLLADFGEPLAGRMLYFNGETMEFTVIKIEKNKECQICSGGKS